MQCIILQLAMHIDIKPVSCLQKLCTFYHHLWFYFVYDIECWAPVSVVIWVDGLIGCHRLLMLLRCADFNYNLSGKNCCKSFGKVLQNQSLLIPDLYEIACSDQ